MKINKWIGKLNIKFELRWKRRYKHSIEWTNKTFMEWSMRYGTGVSQISWDIKKPWEFWKKT